MQVLGTPWDTDQFRVPPKLHQPLLDAVEQLNTAGASKNTLKKLRRAVNSAVKHDATVYPTRRGTVAAEEQQEEGQGGSWFQRKIQRPLVGALRRCVMHRCGVMCCSGLSPRQLALAVSFGMWGGALDVLFCIFSESTCLH